MIEWEIVGCCHDWRENRSWTDEKGHKHIERECLCCNELTEIVSAIDIHEWTATANPPGDVE
jgi:hypothetical protein